MKNGVKRLHEQFNSTKIHKNEDGVALIFALGFLSVLLMVGLAFATSALLERKLAINNRSSLQSKLLVNSATSHVMGSLQSSIMNNYNETGTTNLKEVPQQYIKPNAGFLIIDKNNSSGAPDDIKNRPLMISVDLKVDGTDVKTNPNPTDYEKKELQENLTERINNITILGWTNVTLIEDNLSWVNMRKEPLSKNGSPNSKYNTSQIVGRYAYIIEDITGKLNINDVSENLEDNQKTTNIDESKFGIIKYDSILDPNNPTESRLGSFGSDKNKLYTSIEQLLQDSSITSWSQDKITFANNLFTTYSNKEDEIYLRPGSDPTTDKGEKYHKLSNIKFKKANPGFINYGEKFGENQDYFKNATYAKYDSKSENSNNTATTGIEFFNKYDTSLTKEEYNQIVANTIDFLDEDLIPTWNGNSKPKIKVESDGTITGKINLTQAPTFFGNEKVPQINEITIGINGSVKLSPGESATDSDDADFSINIYPAIEFTDIYNADLSQTFRLFLNVEIEASKLIDNTPETWTINAKMVSKDFQMDSLLKNKFYILNDNTNVFLQKTFSDFKSQLNINDIAINISKITVKSCFLARKDGSEYIVVDYANTDKFLNPKFASGTAELAKVVTSGTKNSETYVFPLEVKDPRVNLAGSNWEWDPETPIESSLNGTAFTWTDSEIVAKKTLEVNNFNAKLENKFLNDPAKDYKIEMEKDLETVTSFGELKHYFPNKIETTKDLIALGNVSRGKAFQTLNFSRMNPKGYIGKYLDGDANILQHIKLSELVKSPISKFNLKGANPEPTIVVLNDILKSNSTEFTGITIDNTEIEALKTKLIENKKNFDDDNLEANIKKRKNDFMSTTNATAAPELYNFYGVFDMDCISNAVVMELKDKIKEQEKLDFLLGNLWLKSSQRYFYYKINTVSQSITDLDTGTTEVAITKDLGETLNPVPQGIVLKKDTIYTLKSLTGRYDPYVDTINSTKKAKVIIRWDNVDKKFEIISYENLEQ